MVFRSSLNTNIRLYSSHRITDLMKESGGLSLLYSQYLPLVAHSETPKYHPLETNSESVANVAWAHISSVLPNELLCHTRKVDSMLFIPACPNAPT